MPQTITARNVQVRLKKLASRDKSKILQRFFKTGPGQYGEGDIFHGITVPVLRALTKEYDGIPQDEVFSLLASNIHEERLLALLMLVRAFAKGDAVLQKKIYKSYLQNMQYINNWDLVDLTAPQIVGAYLTDKSRKPLYILAGSRDLWQRRIAIISTFTFIKQYDFADTLAISEKLLNDDHDLIQKAVGWMLRETGKRDITVEEQFLRSRYKNMPRTMLRYAIERFPEDKRKKYLRGEI
jgi:3-methyladenine DNA glycosylase AlkD